MSKTVVIIRFNPNDEESNEDLARHFRSKDVEYGIYEFSMYLRHLDKYTDQTSIEISEIREKFHDFMKEARNKGLEL